MADTPGPTAEELLAIVAERDHLRAVNADLLTALEHIAKPSTVLIGNPYGSFARAAIAKAKGDADQ